MSAIVYNCIIKDAFTLTINACVFKVITLTGSSTVISLKTIYSGENARLICKCKCTFKMQKKPELYNHYYYCYYYLERASKQSVEQTKTEK